MNGLKDGLNKMREMAVRNDSIYSQYVPVIEDDTTINEFADPILKYRSVQNEFFDMLTNMIAETKIQAMSFRNPLAKLEENDLALGQTVENIQVNPAKAMQFNSNDMAGLLAKYEAQVHSEYFEINSDKQYKVTYTKAKVRKAFLSWSNLEKFVNEIVQSLYNGAYIDAYQDTKKIVASAYKNNKAIIEVIPAVSDDQTAKDFVKKARELFLNFQSPSTAYNSYHKMGGEGDPILTWSRPEDIVFVITNKLRAALDVDLLAMAFNIDKATLLGNIITVDNFDVIDRGYGQSGGEAYDGSHIQGIMCDKAFFKIRTQEATLEDFYNPNSRTFSFFYNVVKMYNFSVFANAVIFADAKPEIKITKLDYNETPQIEMTVGENEGLEIIPTPINGTTEITYSATSGGEFIQMRKDTHNDRLLHIKAVGQGTAVIKAQAGSVSTQISVKVNAPAKAK